MTTRDALTTVLDGGTPDHTPLSIYQWFLGAEPSDEWKRLLDMGLGLTDHIGTVCRVEHGVENTSEERHEGDRHYRIHRKKTPVGTVQSVSLNGWHYEDWIKGPSDYKVFQWMVENTELRTCYANFDAAEARIGSQGLALVMGSRTPAMVINVDIAGTERFCMDVALEVPELFELYEAMRAVFIEETRLIAAGPGRYVKWLENLTIGMLGPERYRQLLMPLYDLCTPILAASGKRVMVHYDGALSPIADQIATAPFHIIESLTEPPEGDLPYDECRRLWPDKVFWCNLNVGAYGLPADELRRDVMARRQRAGKRGVAFEVSEDVPANWRESIPVVLETLRRMD